MGIETIIGGIITLLLAVVTFVIKRLDNKKDNRNALGNAEVDELEKGMAAVDAATPPRVQPPQP